MSDPIRRALESAVAGAYRIERELGRGGMGAVFLARDLALDREVAIKVLPPDLATNATLRERFVREARLAASLSHPNIVHVHAVLEHGELLAIVMQYVDGETLTERVARSGPYDAADTARLLQDTAWALGYAHARGIVHRDVKPDNLLIERGTGRPMILDFGIARTEQAKGLTEVGQSIGTPHYMSPEQAAAEEVDGRSDLYSLGCVGFFAATGRTVFQAEAAHRLLMLHLTQAAQDVTELRPEFPKPLSDVIARALRKDRGERFETGEEMAEAIAALHLRAREVAPLLRLLHQQTAQSLQAVLTMGVLFVVLWSLSPRQDDVMRAFILVLFLTMLITILGQSFDRVRFAVRQGFTAPDVRTAVEAITDETARAREQLLSDPLEFARLQRRKRIAFFGGLLGGLSQPVAISMFVSARIDGVRQVQTLGIVIVLIGAMAIGASVALWAMRPVRITLAQRLAGRFWLSAAGRWMFARAERRYAAELARAKT
ncbi:serine/threonine-protein kinase [Pseudogemmatithrix spongiicola]|uniref:non-specific serine/threonine protein kinase n=1 Tax=Pseudogemmatithrix spongiicola TaxID=3062599 RepID=A0AA49Q654_9BACT|nr:serine/threonine-protein kinase [Gemmatimonadaceae bacterium 'strain 138']WKW14053.1 serine/threonine-protein kinase [Gemmatimonadaceae bacterium 'strain 318']